jgi:hypothetical protein
MPAWARMRKVLPHLARKPVAASLQLIHTTME